VEFGRLAAHAGPVDAAGALEAKLEAVRADHGVPNDLDSFLAVRDGTVVTGEEQGALRDKQVAACLRVKNILSNAREDVAREVRVDGSLQDAGNNSPGPDGISADILAGRRSSGRGVKKRLFVLLVVLRGIIGNLPGLDVRVTRGGSCGSLVRSGSPLGGRGRGIILGKEAALDGRHQRRLEMGRGLLGLA